MRMAALAAWCAVCVALAGCGMPAAPLPPSLHLPAPVGDLSAMRTGNQVALAWTMPSRDTDKVLLKGNVQVRVCRSEGTDAGCLTATTLSLAPNADGAFTDTLPAALTTGAPRVITYFVELDNRKGRSAGLSNGAAILAGQAPGAVSGLRAEVRREGVVLHWTPGTQETAAEAVRLERKLVAQAAVAKKSSMSPAAGQSEPAERTLLVAARAHLDGALDGNVQFGDTYDYRAQRVERVAVDGKNLELAGPFSDAVRVAAVNVYPPAAPEDLAAVATAGQEGTGPAIDLSWQPDTEADLAGYIVYRRDDGAAESSWQRISPSAPVVGPGYHDAQVQAGHSYAYAVSAVDEQGHESQRSAEAHETVPEP